MREKGSRNVNDIMELKRSVSLPSSKMFSYAENPLEDFPVIIQRASLEYKVESQKLYDDDNLRGYS
jgi:hypothetical protein